MNYRDRDGAIDNYRRLRKIKTGRMMTRKTAVGELLDAALAGVPPSPDLPDVIERLDDLEKRLAYMEKWGHRKEDD